MRHCPSSVEGASTALKDVEGGVEVTVTAKGEDAAKEIRARAQFLASKARDTDPSKSEHTGTGQGGGALGRCPVVMKETLVEVADVEGGSRITVKPRSAAELDWLRREARERNAKLSEPGAVDAEPGTRGTRPEGSREVK
ncbi:MAG TPA: hypothetical protein VE093_41280 [Polyangiaceae bacterium]|jgi:antitoxin (DNA-binding transcriptional repressor) of toxin-antitoxin stability system|nr:hypothetical protein [Polyangiaceae bacterium]